MESCEMYIQTTEESEGFLGFIPEEIERSSRATFTLKKVIQRVTAYLSSKFEFIIKKIKKDEAIPVRRYPKRNLARVDYKEEEIPDDDDYIYCDDCQMEWEGDCPEHGPLIIIEDTEITLGPRGKPGPKWAMSTIPSLLKIEPSQIDEAGMGVWTKEKLPKGLRFGPYGGVKVLQPCNLGYCWEIKRKKTIIHYIDAFNPSKSNWMRYVNCARNEEEQNLVAFQYKGEIYYRTIHEILPGVELLVWYGDDYGKELGIDVPSYHKTIQRGQKMGKTSEIPSTAKDKSFSNTHEAHNAGPRINSLQIRSMSHCQQIGKAMLEQKKSTTNLREFRFHREDNNRNDTTEKDKNVTISELPRNTTNKDKPNEDTFSCYECKGEFPTKYLIIKHMKVHFGANLIQYDTQNILFSTKDECERNNYNPFFSEDGLGTDASKRDPSDQKCRRKQQNKENYCKGKTGENIITKSSILYNCKICKKEFPQQQFLKAHILEVHLNKKCTSGEMCGGAQQRIIDNGINIHDNKPTKHLKSSLQRDLSKGSENVLKCVEASNAIEKDRSPVRHSKLFTQVTGTRQSTMNSDLSCGLNEMAFKKGTDLDKPYSCSVCTKSFKQKSNLSSHMLTHTGDRPHSCSVCSKSFTLKSNLERHTRIHTGERPYSCTVCSKRFTDISNLRTHILTHSGDRPHSCSMCSKKFALSCNLRMHMLTHTGDRPHSCSVCSKSFKLKHNLETHTRIHTGERPYSCTVCSKGFARKGVLEQHTRIHTGERPYSCTVCSKGFAHKSVLEKHIRVHTGERPYSCTVCSKRFTQKINLRTHMLTHSGDRPHSCSMCSRKFSQSCNLRRHMETHTTKHSFKCHHCLLEFAQKSMLRNHILSSHLNEED